jgi:hypothetical protein
LLCRLPSEDWKNEPALVSAAGGAGFATQFSVTAASWPARAAVTFTTTLGLKIPAKLLALADEVIEYGEAVACSADGIACF